ncbi:phosphotransferase [Phytoactinopolyspora limicola]|uniref:phosphotransferase n=1 Tax=Phytoactinopolyspora limicola TaxID=2715536 RepID=UPI0014093AC3|nr:phosphotransferase [Phytoactinopolyspora limicola]
MSEEGLVHLPHAHHRGSADRTAAPVSDQGMPYPGAIFPCLASSPVPGFPATYMIEWHSMADDPANTEVTLAGGNSNRVTRLGATVRRNTGPHTPAVHALLQHLERHGFTGSPRLLGVESGREILSFIDGEAGTYPIKPAVQTAEALDTSVALLLRFHDATAGLALPDGWVDHHVAGTTNEVICHWDAAPYNIVYQGSRAVGLIDFDHAGPGRRIDDIAYLAYRLAPLCADTNLNAGGWDTTVNRLGRLRRILRRYPSEHRTLIPDLVTDRLERMKHWILTRSAADDPTVEVHIRENHVGIYAADQHFITSNRDTILSALQ